MGDLSKLIWRDRRGGAAGVLLSGLMAAEKRVF
jgi:hypothetical protein